jgi:hypothetical protein
MSEDQKPRLVAISNAESEAKTAEPLSIAKPGAFDLNQFRSKTPETVAGVERLLTALPHHRISEARDFVRLHPREEDYWSFELCFVNVPIKGMKKDTLHLINETVAMRYLPSKVIQRFRLALASKPYDVFFLCHVPTRYLDNMWNSTNLDGCEQAKRTWVRVNSRKGENAEGYDIGYTRHADAFPEPEWPRQSLCELIAVTFHGRMVEQDDHPGLARLIGDKPGI